MNSHLQNGVCVYMYLNVSNYIKRCETTLSKLLTVIASSEKLETEDISASVFLHRFWIFFFLNKHVPFLKYLKGISIWREKTQFIFTWWENWNLPIEHTLEENEFSQGTTEVRTWNAVFSEYSKVKFPSFSSGEY